MQGDTRVLEEIATLINTATPFGLPQGTSCGLPQGTPYGASTGYALRGSHRIRPAGFQPGGTRWGQAK